MSITPSKQTSVYRQVDGILKTEDIYCGDKYLYIVLAVICDSNKPYWRFYTKYLKKLPE